jgi:hypothetical protein
MKAYWGVDIEIRVLFTSALVGSEWSASRHGRFTPREQTPSTHWIGLNDVERRLLPFLGLEIRTLGRPARIQSLYRLRYPG